MTFDLDREAFGAFLSGLRKEKGYTQKELAQKLLVSDKAVSKWECGKSLPDISLLIPLADILGVTVTELLECRRLTAVTENAEQLEGLVKKALVFSEDRPGKTREQMRAHGLRFGAVFAISFLEMLLLYKVLGQQSLFHSVIFVCEILSVIFCGYFWLFAKERLPLFYDQYDISFYNDGFFRMNMPGVHFNNSSWPHILQALRLSLSGFLVAAPLIYLGICLCFPEFPLLSVIREGIVFLLFFVLLFVPVYVVGKRYA